MNRWITPFVLIAAIPTAAQAQPYYHEPTVLTLHPAGEPSPALKYTLLPKRRDLVPGNAAVFYHRALLILQQRRDADQSEARRVGNERPEVSEEDLSDWIYGPIDEIPLDQAQALLDRYGSILREVELGVLRRDCDWGFDNRPETIELLLPEIQESRSLARLVSLRVRLAILDGDTEGAVHWLQTGYAMARHVGQGPTLWQGLVGIAIVVEINNDLARMIQAEGTPSLYWALAHLPRPMIDLDEAIEWEWFLVERMLPDLLELNGPAWSAERGRLFLDRMAEQFAGLSDSGPRDADGMKLLLTGVVARGYPDAKLELIASGKSEAEVEAMPAIHVVSLVQYRRYVELNAGLYKWVALPQWQSHRAIDQKTYGLSSEEKLTQPLVALFAYLQPGLNSVRIAQARADRQIAALRCVEAIRLYADSHDGRFPPSLEAIEEAPAPLDPATGEPFGYEVEGDEAALSAPLIPGGPDHPAYRIDYRLQMAD